MFNIDDKYVRMSQKDIRIILKGMSASMRKIDVTSDILEVYTRLYDLCKNTEDIPKAEEFAVNWIDNPNFDPEAYHEYAIKIRHHGCGQDAYEYADYDLREVMEYRKKKFSIDKKIFS